MHLGVRSSRIGILYICSNTRLAEPNAKKSPTCSTSSASPVPSNCCFVVQDVVQENWWELYSTSVYFTINLTSITTLVTPYVNSTLTNYETNIYPVNVSTTQIYKNGENPASLFWNNAPQPVEVTSVLDSSVGSQTVTAGVTM